MAVGLGNCQLEIPPDRSRHARALFLILAISTLGLITTVNRLTGRALQAAAGDRLAWLADLCLPSLLACLIIYLAVRPVRRFALPSPDSSWPVIYRLATGWLLAWLAASTLAAAVVGHWIRYTNGALAITCFVLLGPLQEELLFRGALFELAERGWPGRGPWHPVLLTALPFSLQHFQFHQFHLTPGALLQVGFTFPMGIVFGRLREQSGSLWPGLAVHILTNLPGAFGR
jgi:membrane protease YdiL (CAAX protease family)